MKEGIYEDGQKNIEDWLWDAMMIQVLIIIRWYIKNLYQVIKADLICGQYASKENNIPQHKQAFKWRWKKTNNTTQ